MSKSSYNPVEVKLTNQYMKLTRMYFDGRITAATYTEQCTKMKVELGKAGIDIDKFIAKTKNIIP